PGRFTSGEDAEQLIVDWIEDRPTSLDRSRPVAILGAYGLGKSSLASRLASDLARKARLDPSNRMPILIRLGEVGGTQDIASLLGKHFTDTHNVPGYSFE